MFTYTAMQVLTIVVLAMIFGAIIGVFTFYRVMSTTNKKLQKQVNDLFFDE